MTGNRLSENLLGVLAVISACALLYVLWISSREFAHTYGHWVENIAAVDLPVLTVAVLPFVGLGDQPSWSLAAQVAWIVAALWPIGILVPFLRSSVPSRAALLALGLFAWLVVLLAATVLVAVGLWLPFSLL